MKYLISFFCVVVFCQISWSQKSERKSFVFTVTPVQKVLAEVEEKFDVKYSYVDSIAVGKKITLPKALYSLEEINNQISEQTTLSIVKIDNRFYSIVQQYQEIPPKIYTLDDVLVEAFLAKGITKTSQKVVLYPQIIQTLPGVTDADILLTLQQLPGVKSPNETASGLHVRGGSPDQNLVLWDGIRLYHPGHLFGMISAINPNVNQTVNYYNQAVNPKFGERISSVIDVKTSDKISEKTFINAGLNALNADLYLQTPLIKNKLGLQLSGRKSFTEWLQSPTFEQLAKKVFQNTNFKDFSNQNQFQFQDYSAKLNYKLNPNSEYSLTALWIDNNLDFKSKSADSEFNKQTMSISNFGFSFNWKQKFSKRFEQKLLIFYSAYDFDYEKRQQHSDVTFEGYKKLNRLIDSGTELNYSFGINNRLKWDFGYQFLGNDVSHLFNSYNQNLGVVLDLKHHYNVSQVGYSFLKYEYQKWNLQVGMRYAYYVQLKKNSFEPRIMVQRQLSESLIGQLSYEGKSQVLSQIREDFANDLSLENYVWVLAGKDSYPIQRANQCTLGFIFKKNSWLLDAGAYYKTIKGITSFTFDFQNQYDYTIHQGNGFTKGVDVLLQKSASDWRAWMTYTFQDSQHKFDGVNQNEYFQMNSNSKHALNFSFYKKWKSYNLALGWFWHTGKPYSSINETGEIISYNSEVLPDYHRLDISGFYQFKDKHDWNYKVGFSVYNLYNRHQILSKELERKYTVIGDFMTANYTVQNYYSLGIMPNVFIRMNF
ncbi:TonB-dependent receptor plug domain-containing protein [Flavobacterium sp. XGLA_31]|uniref:TonB-dependent receptor plug domain-containing protein n=1 Tax=Flavobacterium sp. XGLA_31 TaxID=3447666 RepID=UPI003F332F39